MTLVFHGGMALVMTAGFQIGSFWSINFAITNPFLSFFSFFNFVTEMTIKAVIFDIGGVCVGSPMEVRYHMTVIFVF
jgi:hypothetical protein